MVFLLAIIAYDAYACHHREKMQTLSEMITRASFRYLMIPVIAGILIGHFFWSQKNVFKGVRI
jgi:ACR3 family arsenite efflux pump ArsB